MRAVLLGEEGLQPSDCHEAKARPGEERVRVLRAGICETDLQLVAGYMGFRGVLGHEFVGIAESGPLAGQRVVGEINCGCGSCSDCRRGDPRHCPGRTVIGILNHDGAFAEALHVPRENLLAVPDNVGLDQATLVEPLAAAFQIAEQVDLPAHRQAVVIGDGRLGYLCSQVLHVAGCDVTVVGKHEAKLQRFRDRGVATAHVDEPPKQRTFDLAVDCCGHTSGLVTALQWLRPRGTLVLKTTVSQPHQLSLAALVIDEIRVVGSRCGRFAPALQALADEAVEVESMITARFGLQQAEAAFAAANSGQHMKVLFEMGD